MQRTGQCTMHHFMDNLFIARYFNVPNEQIYFIEAVKQIDSHYDVLIEQ